MPAPKKFKDPLSRTQDLKPSVKLSVKRSTPTNLLMGVLLPPSPAAATQELPLTPQTKDVSGSISPGLTKKYNKDYLKDRWTSLSGRMMDWLNEGDRLESLMAETKLRDIGVMLGIATEKVLLLDGQPTQIIGQPQHQALDRLGLALKDALDKRGLVTLTERKVDIKLDGPGTPKQTL